MNKRTSADVRREFIEFFEKRCAHTFVRSSPCVPIDDPTLMFTNAGMNQFKPIFLGTVDRNSEFGRLKRAVNTQKCIRAGGKHNDLDDVGHDTYHHTFFEMLGNWSFGDYFKKEAIAWAWELLTGIWGVDGERLHATYFEGDASEGLAPDTEARDFWLKILPPERIHPGNKKDNFWEMGDTGPCGPCSEIHIDLTPDRGGGPLVNAGDARVIEIWNLVFIQFNRGPDGKLTPLPAKHVDTGMGFERICAVVLGQQAGQLGRMSNYDTDVFTPIFAAIERVTGAETYTGLLEETPKSRNAETSKSGTAPQASGPTPQAPSPRPQAPSLRPQVMRDVAYRVVADHIRTLTFAITDGAVPSNEGRGFVLRRILRRAVRYGRQYLGTREPFMCKLVPAVVEAMGEAFPELRAAHRGQNVEHVATILRGEEESFIKTLDRGIALFENAALSALTRVHPRSLHATSPTRVGGFRSPLGHYIAITVDGHEALTKRLGFDDLSPELISQFFESSPEISGENAFKLHDTYGFPIDLTELMAEERGLTVNIGEYERLMEEAREKARGSGKWDRSGAIFTHERAQEMLAKGLRSQFIGYERLEEDQAYVSRIVSGNNVSIFSMSIRAGESGAVLLSTTPFYAEKGGQVGDVGSISNTYGEFLVEDTQETGGFIVHLGRCTRGIIAIHNPVEAANLPLDGPLGPRAAFVKAVRARVDSGCRTNTMRNHTATHIMNWALREVLGEHVQQKGSLVDSEKTRFDLSHHAQITDDELTRIEQLTNKQIEGDLRVFTENEVDQAQAREINTLRAVFGEKYPDRVRVVSVGAPIDELLKDPKNAKWQGYSVEFCGGTHAKSTGEIGKFRLIEESAVAKGVRRVTGITSDRAEAAEKAAGELARDLDAALRSEPSAAGGSVGGQRTMEEAVSDLGARLATTELPIVEKHRLQTRFAELQERVRQQKKADARAGAADAASKADALLAEAATVGATKVIAGELGEASVDQLRAAADSLRSKAGSAAVLLAAANDGKVVLLAAMTPDVVQRGLKAGDVIKEIAPIVGGKGGGRPDIAQGGGADSSRIGEAVEKGASWMKGKLG